jgi:PAS domain-containing protein
MADLSHAHPQVRKNLLLIRGILAAALTAFVVMDLQAPDPPRPWLYGYLGFLALSFLPLLLRKEEAWEQVHSQYVVFAMDLAFILTVLYLVDHLETEFLLSFFLTLFISALSRSVANSLLVGLAVTGLYAYRVYWVSPSFDPLDPFLALSCTLLILVALHSGYLAYRAVVEEQDLVELARRMALLDREAKEGSKTAMEYAGTLKNVLDTLPLGALAVSREGDIIFVNQTASRILETHAKALLGLRVGSANLGRMGESMGRSVAEKVDLKKEYLDMDWNGRPRRFRLDSSVGSTTGGTPWGTLFLLQEASTPPGTEAPKK